MGCEDSAAVIWVSARCLLSLLGFQVAALVFWSVFGGPADVNTEVVRDKDGPVWTASAQQRDTLFRI